MNENEKVVCSICGKELKMEDAYYDPDGGYICEECHATNVSVCDDCQCEYWNHEMTEIADRDNYHVCVDCLPSYYQCPDCGRYFTSLYDGDGGEYCRACVVNHPLPLVDRDNPIVGYHNNHSSAPIFFKTDADVEMPYLGVELEVDTRDGYPDNDAIACDILDVMPDNFIYFESDGSLDNGFENITQPATLAYHESIESNYKKMFTRIRRGGLRSHQTKTCGLHVHFNRNFFTPDEEEACVARLLYMVENFWDDIAVFSRRSRATIERWANKYNDDPAKVAKNWKDGSFCYERYHAVNLTNRNTIEFRMFRGTLKYNTFIATLQFCQNLIMTAKTKSVADIQSMQFTDLINTPELEQYWEEAQERKKPKTVNTEVVSGDDVADSDID